MIDDYDDYLDLTKYLHVENNEIRSKMLGWDRTDRVVTTLTAVEKILIILRMSSLLFGPVLNFSNCLNDKKIGD